jgi:hypothetical protein
LEYSCPQQSRECFCCVSGPCDRPHIHIVQVWSVCILKLEEVAPAFPDTEVQPGFSWITSEYGCICCRFLAPAGVKKSGSVHCYWHPHPAGVFGLGSLTAVGYGRRAPQFCVYRSSVAVLVTVGCSAYTSFYMFEMPGCS